MSVLPIQFTGRNIDLTDTLIEFTKTKFQKLQRHTDNITSIHVTFGVEKLRQIAEAKIHLPGADLHATSENEDMYTAIIELVDKLDRQISKQKKS